MFEYRAESPDEIRLAQMIVVERVVRPVRANIARKRRMRDELLAHLSAIYDDELARSEDPVAAVNAAAKRFGNTIELTAELQATVPRREQWEHSLESWFGWHAPETATRWMSRVAIQLFLIMFGTCLLTATLAFGEFGWSYGVWLTVRPIAAAALVMPICAFSYGVCYYRIIRNHFFGVFGSQRSWSNVVFWAALLNFTTVASSLIFLIISYGSLAAAVAAFYPIVVFGLIWAGSAIAFAPIFGPQEIRDTTWALLDLDDQPLAA
jgi:hypothetical protein